MTDHTPAGPPRDGANGDSEQAIERITARYINEYRAGLAPRAYAYIRQYPQYARELADFFLYFHAVAVDVPDPDPAPMSPMPSAAVAALARYRGRYAQEYALAGLARRGLEVGVAPPTLAEKVGLSLDLFARLEARAIAAASIPHTLIRRFAEVLRVAPEAIASYLTGAQGGQPASAFFYAEAAPQTGQDSFLDAVRASDLPPAEQREWERIVREEGIGA